jgi:hypothetical protein
MLILARAVGLSREYREFRVAAMKEMTVCGTS